MHLRKQPSWPVYNIISHVAGKHYPFPACSRTKPLAMKQRIFIILAGSIITFPAIGQSMAFTSTVAKFKFHSAHHLYIFTHSQVFVTYDPASSQLRIQANLRSLQPFHQDTFSAPFVPTLPVTDSLHFEFMGLFPSHQLDMNAEPNEHRPFTVPGQVSYGGRQYTCELTCRYSAGMIQSNARLYLDMNLYVRSMELRIPQTDETIHSLKLKMVNVSINKYSY